MLAAAGFAAACRTAPRPDANAVALEAFRLIQSGKTDAGMELLAKKSMESPVLTDLLAVALSSPDEAESAAEACLRAANAGLHVAEYRYALMLLEGRGMAADPKRAFEWLKKAAEGGWPDAQNELAVAYESGRPVPADSAAAAGWFRKAAEQGHAEAMMSLAFLYAEGKGVSRDDALALEWTRKAAERDVAEAQLQLGYRYSHGKGVPADREQAFQWLMRAFRNGSKEALLDVAVMLATGTPGGHKDEPLAYALFLLAEARGIPRAADGARSFGKTLTQEQRAAGRKLYDEIPREPTERAP